MAVETSSSCPQPEVSHYGKESAGAEDKRSEFYDVLLLGKTGLGKTATALKLLEWDDHKYEGKIKPLNLDTGLEDMERTASKPLSGGGLKHLTSDIQAWLNSDTKMRVVDVPGFADTIRHPLLDLWKKNLFIVYRISRLTKVFRFSRVLYFLPNRGVPERVDGYLREELQLIYKFFGDLVFKVMVVVYTNHPDPRYQNLGSDPNYKVVINEVMNGAIKEITKRDHNELVLEVIYIALSDDNEAIKKKVMDAHGEKVDTKLDLDTNACIKCAGNDPLLHEVTWHVLSLFTFGSSPACHPRFIKMSHADCQWNPDVEQMSENDRVVYEFYCQTKCRNCGRPPGTIGCTKIRSSEHSLTIPQQIDLPSLQNSGNLTPQFGSISK